MRKNATVSVYAPTLTPGPEGNPVKTWGYKQTPAIAGLATFRADVQPHLFRELDRELWELCNRQADTKEMFTSGYVPSIANGNRAAVVTDYDGVTRHYDILAANQYPHHSECLLVPLQGES
jgi:hypothetical protein